MTQFEIFSIVISIIGLLVLIIGFWIKSKVDIAQVQAQYSSLQNELKEHKQEDNFRYDQMRKENREDHRLLFEKIDKLIIDNKPINDHRRTHSDN